MTSKYMQHLNDIVIPHVYNFFLNIYETSTPKGKNLLKSFQKNLENSENYTNDDVKNITKKILQKYKEKLLLKILMEESESKNPELFLKISFDDYILQLLVNCRKDLWSNPNLFYKDGLNTYEIQKNYKAITNIIKENISKSIRSFIPYDVLLTNDMQELDLNQEYSDEECLSENEESEDDVLFDDLEN